MAADRLMSAATQSNSQESPSESPQRKSLNHKEARLILKIRVPAFSQNGGQARIPRTEGTEMPAVLLVSPSATS